MTQSKDELRKRVEQRRVIASRNQQECVAAKRKIEEKREQLNATIAAIRRAEDHALATQQSLGMDIHLHNQTRLLNDLANSELQAVEDAIIAQKESDQSVQWLKQAEGDLESADE